MKFIVASKKIFGKREGQTLREFLDENNQLTPQDKQGLGPMLEKELDTIIEDIQR